MVLYGRTYERTCGRMDVRMDVRVDVWTYVWTYVWIFPKSPTEKICRSSSISFSMHMADYGPGTHLGTLNRSAPPPRHYIL